MPLECCTFSISSYNTCEVVFQEKLVCYQRMISSCFVRVVGNAAFFRRLLEWRMTTLGALNALLVLRTVQGDA